MQKYESGGVNLFTKKRREWHFQEWSEIFSDLWKWNCRGLESGGKTNETVVIVRPISVVIIITVAGVAMAHISIDGIRCKEV